MDVVGKQKQVGCKQVVEDKPVIVDIPGYKLVGCKVVGYKLKGYTLVAGIVGDMVQELGDTQEVQELGDVPEVQELGDIQEVN